MANFGSQQLVAANSLQLDEDVRLLIELKKMNPSFQLTDAARKRLRDAYKKSSTVDSKIQLETNLNQTKCLEAMQNQINLLQQSKSLINSDGFVAGLIKWDYKIDTSKFLYFIMSSVIFNIQFKFKLGIANGHLIIILLLTIFYGFLFFDRLFTKITNNI